MKNIYFLLLLLSTTSAFAQSYDALQFDSRVKNFGEVHYGDTAEVKFVFKNISKKQIEIKEVKSNSRSISFIVKDRQVKPGKVSTITVLYNAKEVGSIRNTISIYTSGQPEIYTLAVRGNVIKQ